jgi:hypothetical protein
VKVREDVSKGKNPRPAADQEKSQRECGIDGSVICEQGKGSPQAVDLEKVRENVS